MYTNPGGYAGCYYNKNALSSVNPAFTGSMFGPAYTANPGTGFFGWNGRSIIRSGADGNINLENNAENSFGLLQFGGTNNTFPALKRSTTVLQARLADDSAFTSITCNGLQLGGTSASFSGLFDGGSAQAWCRKADNASFAILVADSFQARNAAASGTGLTIGGTTQTTVGATGAASVLPANPLGYIKAFVGAVAIAIPYYTQ